MKMGVTRYFIRSEGGFRDLTLVPCPKLEHARPDDISQAFNARNPAGFFKRI